MRKFFKQVVKFIGWGFVISTLLAYLCPYIDPSVFPWFVHFGTAFGYLMLINLGFIAFWLYKWERVVIFHILLLLLGWNHVTALVGLNFNNAEKVHTDTSILVGTHNIGGMMRLFNAKRKQRDSLMTIYTDYIRKNGTPDVFCLQETGRLDRQHIQKKLDYPHIFNLKKGTVIFSKYPMAAGGDIEFSDTNNSTLWVNLNIKGKIVRVYSIHLESNHVTVDTEDVIEHAEWGNEKTWQGIKSLLKTVLSATGKRAAQAKAIREHIQNCPYPVILCGDFNDTQNSYAYRLLSANRVDSFREKGRGLGSTLSRLIPLLKIDHILHDPSIKTESCRVLKRVFSDHFPVYARMGW